MTYLLRRVKHYAHETGPEDERDGPARHVRPSFLALGLRANLLHDWLAFVEGRSFDSFSENTLLPPAGESLQLTSSLLRSRMAPLHWVRLRLRLTRTRTGLERVEVRAL